MKKSIIILLMISVFSTAHACISCVFAIGAVTGYVFNNAVHTKDSRDTQERDRGCRSQIYTYDNNGRVKSVECIRD